MHAHALQCCERGRTFPYIMIYVDMEVQMVYVTSIANSKA